MRQDTTALERQLQLVELDGDGVRRGPTVLWPGDWPSAAASVDLEVATLPQAVAAWRDWVTSADEQRLVDVASSGLTEMVVLVGGRAFLAWLSDASTAPVTLLGATSDPWAVDGAGAAPDLATSALRAAGSAATDAGQVEGGPAASVTGVRPAIDGERCSCGRPAVTVYVTEQFGDVGYCGIPDGGAR